MHSSHEELKTDHPYQLLLFSVPMWGAEGTGDWYMPKLWQEEGGKDLKTRQEFRSTEQQAWTPLKGEGTR